MNAHFWNERYSANEFVYGKSPNHFFAQTIDGLKPGRMLLPCEGEGRNAVYAATLSWEVTAFDQSLAGQSKCQRLSLESNVKVHYNISDALQFEFGEAQFDCIGLIYAHFSPNIRQRVHQKVVRCLAPSGILILEAFEPKQLENQSGGPKQADMLYTIDMLKEDFKDLKIKTLEVSVIKLDEGAYHQGKANVIRLIAEKG